MAARTTNNQAPVVQQEQVILSPEEYQMVLNQRAAQAAPAPQAPVQQAAPAPTSQLAPIPQTTQQQAAPAPQAQQAQPVDPKAEKKNKILKAGKTVLKTTLIAGAGAAVATGVFLLTKSDDAAEDAAEGTAALIGSWF